MRQDCVRARLLYALFLLLLAILAAFSPLGQRLELGGRARRTVERVTVVMHLE